MVGQVSDSRRAKSLSGFSEHVPILADVHGQPGIGKRLCQYHKAAVRFAAFFMRSE